MAEKKDKIKCTKTKSTKVDIAKMRRNANGTRRWRERVFARNCFSIETKDKKREFEDAGAFERRYRERRQFNLIVAVHFGRVTTRIANTILHSATLLVIRAERLSFPGFIFFRFSFNISVVIIIHAARWYISLKLKQFYILHSSHLCGARRTLYDDDDDDDGDDDDDNDDDVDEGDIRRWLCVTAKHLLLFDIFGADNQHVCSLLALCTIHKWYVCQLPLNT